MQTGIDRGFAQEQQRFQTLLANADSPGPSFQLEYVGINYASVHLLAWRRQGNSVPGCFSSQWVQGIPMTQTLVRCQGEAEAAALKKRMAEETKVIMAVWMPSMTNDIYRLCV